MKILVVEDVLIAQKIAKLILMDLRYNVDIAKDGTQALKMFKENNYAFIFMDIGLPDISGVEVTKKIREMERGEDHVPIVALTANYDESYKPICLEAGMDECMLKPLTKEKAKSILAKFI